MSGSFTYGVIGGYGATGSAVATELSRSGDGEILIGARNLAKASVIATQLGPRTSAARVDVLDAKSLDHFCGQCSIIVNCAGPVMELRDRVAQAAFRARRNYVDVAGMLIVKERMLAHDREMADSGLSCVVSAGWLPGLTELVPLYAAMQARERMDAIESVTAYLGDEGGWSANALRDGVWYLRKNGPGSHYFRKGKRVRGWGSRAFAKIDPGAGIGTRRLSMSALAELSDIAWRLDDCELSSYVYMPGMRTALAGLAVAFLPLSMETGARLLEWGLRSDDLPVGGFIVVKVAGRSGSRSVRFTVRIVFEKQRGYWLNGLAAATASRMIAQCKGVRPGVHFLAGAVDPAVFVAELRDSGVKLVSDISGAP